MQEQISEIIYYAKGALRYKWAAIIVAWAISLVGWTYIYNMPDKYSSSARVHVDTRTMLRPLLSGLAIQVDVDGLLRVMKQLMFTQKNLEQIANLASMKGLDAHDLLKNNIKISGGNNELFSISYEAKSPEEARDVVQAVLTVFSEQTQLRSLGDTDEAQRFIEGQIQEYEIRLRNAEKARENFKRANLGLLPGQGADQISQIQQMKLVVEEAELQLNEAISRKQALNEQLEEAMASGEEDEFSDLETAETGAASSPQDIRINELKQRRDELLLKYTKNHPEIVHIEKTIIELEKLRDEKLALQAAESPTEESGFDLKAMENPYVQSVKVALNEADANIASMRARVENLKARLVTLQEELNNRLSIETEVENLNRDYEAIKGNYESLIQRREQANISEKVDTQVNALKFKIADPPNKPLEPSSPNRLLLSSVVFIFGVAAGVALSLLLILLRPTFVATRQVRADTGLPILGTISFSNEQESHFFARDYKAVGALLGLIIIYVALLVVEISMPAHVDIKQLAHGIYGALSSFL
ncbi:MAG: XrtA system polysaccharide chain length determinant [Methylococcaceae bacterium]|jgi:polysaccharide chain length determinant protein (PEP-CTERM system associated)